MQARSIAERLQQATRGSAGPCAGGCAPPRGLRSGRPRSPACRAGVRVRSPAASPRTPRPRASQRDVGIQTEDSIIEDLQAKVAQLQKENERLKQLARPAAGMSAPSSAPAPVVPPDGGPAEPAPSSHSPRLFCIFSDPHPPPWWPHSNDPAKRPNPDPTGPRPGGPVWVREWMSPAVSPQSEPDGWPPLTVVVAPPQGAPRGQGGAPQATQAAAAGSVLPPPVPRPRVGPLGRLKAAWRRAFGGGARGGATPATQQRQQEHAGGAPPSPQRATAAESAPQSAAAGAPQSRAPAQPPPAAAAPRGFLRAGGLRRAAGRL
eukprot:TRINITY_DN18746_c0_g4_i1.p1 TRINITY_DN18746_c0_g4~~TRINITY_DN18746_c0_g4_i1.p1  ORF type:complete len:350 (+),score=43.76 TRINITY_DN18746_c0_g4_i1:96-1052(+)